MEQLIEFIMSNLFLIIIIISGIVGFFNNQQKENEKRQKKKQGNRPNPAPSPTKRNPEPKGKPLGRMDTEQQASMKTVEDQQKEQMDRLAKTLKTEAKQAVDEVTENVDVNNLLKEIKTKSLQQEKVELKKQVRHNLRGKRLINGIIMSEVLGPPRAIKPYRSIVQERRTK